MSIYKRNVLLYLCGILLFTGLNDKTQARSGIRARYAYTPPRHLPRIGQQIPPAPSLRYDVLPFREIWSRGSDLAPVMSYNSREIFFSSNRQDRKHYHIYHAPMKGMMKLAGKPVRIPLLKGATFEGVPYVTARGEYLFFSAHHKDNLGIHKENNIDADIYYARRSPGSRKSARFGRPVHMSVPVNSPYSEITPCLSVDGRFLYFASNRPGGYGGYDIYVSEWEDNRWGKPVNVGSGINSEDDEIFPRIFPDGSRMFYSSNRPGGYGGHDIYSSHNIGQGQWWSASENAGTHINTKENDYLNTIPLRTNYFLVSRGQSGREKIYGITPVPEQLRPQKTVLGSFVARDARTQKAIPFHITVRDSRGRKVFRGDFKPHRAGKIYHDADSLVRTLQPGKSYQLFATADGYMFYTEKWRTPADKNYYSKVFRMEPLRENASVSIRNLFFEKNTADLKKGSHSVVRNMARFFKDNNITIQIEGHTARVSDKQEAMRLSRDRARSVKELLASLGIDEERMKTRGYGYSKPISRSKRHLNRRVEIRVLKLE
jgi:outer membrane protein OmpA-like peptidoglycan-associated protein/Tol biopolymer transport system component